MPGTLCDECLVNPPKAGDKFCKQCIAGKVIAAVERGMKPSERILAEFRALVASPEGIESLRVNAVEKGVEPNIFGLVCAIMGYLDEQHALRPDADRDFRRQALLSALKEAHLVFQNAQLALAGIETKVRNGPNWEQDIESVIIEARTKGLL